jgi:DMSO/TMAO reductase YedYZ molybdopterin-dependent catalytic subunit
MDLLKLDLNKSGPDPPTESELRFQVALLSAVAALIASFVARFAFGAPLIPELLAQSLFAIAPIWAVEIAIGILGSFAKHLAFLGCTVLYLLALIGAAIGYLRYSNAKASALMRRSAPFVFAFSIWVLTVSVLLPLLSAGPFGSRSDHGALFACIALLVSHAIYGATLRITASQYIERPASLEAPGKIISRRRMVRGIGYAVLAVGIFDIASSLIGSWFRSGSGRVKGGSGKFPEIDGLALEITPTNDFYVVSKNAFDPQLDRRSWKLEIGGMVDNPISLTYEDVTELPSVDQYATLACISNEVGGDLIGNALWRGVRLKDLLKQAGLRQGIVDIVLTARDGYTDSIPLERAIADGAMLAYAMNGEPLTREHGFPLRLIVPGIYGMKNVKWITRIEAVDFDYKGYWQRRGWDDRAEYKTLSRIDAPARTVRGETSIAGIAFAGDRGISKVEVSTDGERSWQQVEVKPALSQFTWVLWNKLWTPGQSGKHLLAVRATDGRGIVQTSQLAPPAPSGSSGLHTVVVPSE